MKGKLYSWLKRRNLGTNANKRIPQGNWFDRFLLFCAGRSHQDLEGCPPKTFRDYKIAGSLILVPTLLALFSGNIAASRMTDNWLVGMLGAMLFALIIFLIDRNVFAMTKPRELNLAVFCRIVLILVFSIVLSEPFVILIFKGAIQNEIVEVQQNKMEEIRANHTLALEEVEAKEKELRTRVDHLKQEFVDEMGGRNGRYGYGPNAKKIEELYKGSQAEFRQSLQENEERRSELEAEKKAALAAVENEAVDISVELKALHHLMQKDTGIAVATWLIRLILILIDLIPISLKWGSKNPDLEFAELIDKQNLNRFRRTERALRRPKFDLERLVGKRIPAFPFRLEWPVVPKRLQFEIQCVAHFEHERCP